MSKEENISSSFFANPHFAFYRISSDGYPVFANQTLIRMLGFSSRDEFIKSFKENPQFRENFSISKYQEHLLKINNTDGVESRWRKKNGRIVVVTEYIQKYFDPTDGSVFYDCIAEDITEKKIIDELMSDVIGRDYAIIKALPDILFILSNDGNFTDYKTGNNSGFPISPDYFVGKSLWDVFPQQISDDLYRTIKETRLNGQLSTYDFQMPGQFGSKHYEARVVKSHQNEVLLLLRDVTNQKQNELQILKIAEDLRQINDTKDKFVSIIAHDVKTPIVALIGYAEILAEDIEELQKSEIKEFASSIVEISKQTIGLLTNLLEWSRLQTGRMEFHPVQMNAFNTAENSISLLASNAEQKNIKIINELDKDTYIYADENMMQSVFNNLLTNAIKFTNRNGEINITSDKCEDMICFSVKDNGVGMDAKQKTLLFEMNKSFTTPGTTNEKGSGLGMILCKDFIEKHGGKIWVESSVGNGSEFFFTVPASVNYYPVKESVL
ncbi:MAG: PAS domain-containing sensor histidine kinase [Ignavibacteriota bacterium]|nr:PAS domain-containing sensor histidine kinase [Ignavibacteriota bacterium]MCO6448183.1 PAS domain-containing sensor histidine kinase [Ignavibacterium album]QKK00189.1 MAG: PAS domain-containing sensor histidine kinase [Ignavibacteriota bacterium]HMN16797.1 PAS domain-containing sensor histidine kinase [Ignavibacteriaceae bacterium]HOJ06373.1 PAS domain-containing sensor histidine kinase [Ignavibacteriaceae bacterium]